MPTKQRPRGGKSSLELQPAGPLATVYGALARAEFDSLDYQRGEVELTFSRTEEWLQQHRKV
jgi:hypothetical protein